MIEVTGVFLEYTQGYYSFKLEDDDIILFEQINRKALAKYDLKSTNFKGKTFDISYTELFDYEDYEDFLVFKIEHLNLIQ